MFPSPSVSGIFPGGGVKPRRLGGELRRNVSTAATDW